MTPERWEQIRDVLEKALELAPDERSAFLNRACSSDQILAAGSRNPARLQRRRALQLSAILRAASHAHVGHQARRV